MSDFGSKSFVKGQNSDFIDDDDFEKDDLITFQHKSKTINFSYSKLTKYSKQIREEYLFSDVIKRFPREIEREEESSQLLPENVDLFFELLEQNYEIKENRKLTYIECIDLLKISKCFEIRKLTYKIEKYIKTHNNEVDFIIQILEYDNKTRKLKEEEENEIISEIENILTIKINECLCNKKFKKLPIEIIYRILKKSSSKEINSNKLFDIIKGSLEKYCVLFRFLELQNLSEDRLSELCELYSNTKENSLHFFDYLKCNLTLINKINKCKKNLEETNDAQTKEMKNLETRISSLQSEVNESKEMNKEQQNTTKELESTISLLQNQLNESKEMNKEQQNKTEYLESKTATLQNQLNESKELNKEQQIKMKDLENQISQLRKHIPKGQIVASVDNGLINAEIKLETVKSTVDTTKPRRSRLAQLKEKLEDDEGQIIEESYISTRKRRLDLNTDQESGNRPRRSCLSKIKEKFEEDDDES